ncbi:hypothetical protein HCDG_07655 [Histoplasma capsulatum H143]|uniref:Uncharacterized protein n=1 Tax=Ajellomyces capsulatus (strain H143) TaxID=544712 RepID=C6HN74_AJECH|nr:hypothetical protein HCDG_07655 [Histoplasma capsulatum H143]
MVRFGLSRLFRNLLASHLDHVQSRLSSSHLNSLRICLLSLAPATPSLRGKECYPVSISFGELRPPKTSSILPQATAFKALSKQSARRGSRDATSGYVSERFLMPPVQSSASQKQILGSSISTFPVQMEPASVALQPLITTRITFFVCGDKFVEIKPMYCTSMRELHTL